MSANRFLSALCVAFMAGPLTGPLATAQQAPPVETLDRGFIGVSTPCGVFLSWRLLASDASSVSFDLYCDGQLVNVSGHLASVTNFTDAEGTPASRYELRSLNAKGKVIEKVELANVWAENSIRIPLDVPAPLVMPDGKKCTYSAGDCSVGDVDGDGQYEVIVKWDPSNAHDNSHAGYTGNVYLDCYEMDGRKLWRIDLGRNIRAGAHYTQFLVYDFDADGRAEVACKTAPGSVDGTGAYVSEASADPAIRNADNSAVYYNKAGHVIDGPEFVTVFSGLTGKALATENYLPGRGIHALDKEGWGDGYGNRSERYLATVAYLPVEGGKGAHCAVFCRGYYTYSNLCAWSFDGKKLNKVWLYQAPSLDQKTTMSGAGAHSVMAADVDSDGFDEIVYGAATLDHDGTLLYNTGWGHGDALHVSDHDPDRPGLEVFMPHEGGHHAGRTHDEVMAYGAELHDARTGEIIWCVESDDDNGRGVAADIDPNYRGSEMWSLESNNVYDVHGKVINEGGERPAVNFRIYWDGDLCDELLDGYSSGNLMQYLMPRRDRRRGGQGGNGGQAAGENANRPEPQRPLPDGVTPELLDSMRQAFGRAAAVRFRPDSISEVDLDLLRRAQGHKSTVVWKWDPEKKKPFALAELPAATINGSKQVPCFSGDLFGDWREEVILVDGDDLVIFTSTIPSDYRVVTLPHDHTYRMGMTSQNAAYNQPPHLGYYLPDAVAKTKKR